MRWPAGVLVLLLAGCGQRSVDLAARAVPTVAPAPTETAVPPTQTPNATSTALTAELSQLRATSTAQASAAAAQASQAAAAATANAFAAGRAVANAQATATAAGAKCIVVAQAGHNAAATILGPAALNCEGKWVTAFRQSGFPSAGSAAAAPPGSVICALQIDDGSGSSIITDSGLHRIGTQLCQTIGASSNAADMRALCRIGQFASKWIEAGCRMLGS